MKTLGAAVMIAIILGCALPALAAQQAPGFSLPDQVYRIDRLQEAQAVAKSGNFPIAFLYADVNVG